MVSQTMITYLKDLKPYKSTWRVQVRVLHGWRQYTAMTGETYELILADESGTKIHASCRKQYVARMEQALPVGEWKVIQNFNLTPATGLYRPTEHAYRMSFVGNTTISQSKLRSTQNFLSLKSFEQVTSGDLKTHFLIDFIGQVVDLGQLETIQCQGKEKKKVEFQLRDAENNRMPCCLWGRFADKLSSYCENAGDKVVICLIRFAKVNIYRGMHQISNAFDMSDLLLNGNFPEFIELKNKLPKDGLALTVVIRKDERLARFQPKVEWEESPQKSISEILNCNEVESCRVICTIYALNTDYAWYYFGHNNPRCNKKVQRQIAQKGTPTFYCEFCDKSVTDVSPKFKLHVKVRDDTDNTNLLLLDTIAKEIVGQSADQLLNGSFEEIEDPEALPQALIDLVGQSFEFGVFIKKENIEYGNDTYKCGKVWNRRNLLECAAITEDHSQVDTIGSYGNPEELTLMGASTEENSESLSTPSKRSSEDLPDLSSSSKKQCTPLIKKEKFSPQETSLDGEKKEE